VVSCVCCGGEYYKLWIYSTAVSNSVLILLQPLLQMTKKVVIVGGPAGCGKSTVGEFISKQLGYSFIEGDTMHPVENIEKMSNGIPLNDNDRWGWLQTIVSTCAETLVQGSNGVVVTCSSLKRSYRNVLRKFDEGVQVVFIFLLVDETALLKRVAARKNHYMKVEMVQSQLATLERPSAEETDTIILYVNAKDSIDQVCTAALNQVEHDRT